MIETEKRAVYVEEFSPTEPLYRENVIRHLVRLASFIIIGLLGVSVVQYYYSDLDAYTNILSPMLIFTLMIVFLVGIFLAFFQLRWINDKRNKSTNLGGTVGFFGLFITFLSSVSSLLALPPAFLFPLLVFGLFLTLIGFFVEMTRIDEPLVFWFRVNLEIIIRYTISLVGAFLVNWSLLSILVLFFIERGITSVYVFPGNLIGGLIIGGIGLGLVWGSWFHQINQTVWRYRVEIIRTIDLSIGQCLILIALAVSFLEIQDAFFLSSILGIAGLAILYLDLYIFKVKVTSHFSKGFVTFSQIFAFFIVLFLILVGLIHTQIQVHDWLFFSFYFPVTGLLLFYRVWFDNINYVIKRTIQTIVWFFRTYYREVITTIGVSFLASGSFLIEFTKIVNPLLVDVLVIDSFFDPIPLGLFLGGYAISVAIWHIPDRHDYFRGLSTTLSITVVLWGILLLGLLLSPPVSSDGLSYGISGFLIIMGICINVWIWRIEIYQSVVYTINTTVLFLKTYYRELITVGTLSFVMYSLVITWKRILNPPHLPFLFLLMGYIVCTAIWRIPDRHDYFRGVTTTLSTGIIFLGILLLFSPYYNPVLVISGGLVVIGGLVNGTVWRVELAQLLRQTIAAVIVAVIQTNKAIWRFLETYYPHLVTIIGVGLMTIGFIGWTTVFEVAFLLFFMGYLLSVIIWHLPSRHVYFRGVATTLSAALFLWGTIQFIFYLAITQDLLSPPVLISYLFIGTGGVVPVVLWRVELAQLLRQTIAAVIAELVQTWEALVQVVKNLILFLKTYRWEILKYSTIVIGIIFLLAGPPLIGMIFMVNILPTEDMMIRGGGIGLLGLTWHVEIITFLKATWEALKQTWKAVIQFLRNTGGALVQAVKNLVLFLKTYRWEILKYTTTIIGLFLLLIGPPLVNWVILVEISPIVDVMIRGGGIGLFGLAWHVEIITFLKATWEALKQTWKAVIQFLRNTWGAFGSFMRKLGIQLNQLFRTAIDLTIPIVFVVLAISVLFYGFILLISGLIDPSGVQMSNMFFSIPILGNFLISLAAIIQGEVYSENLLGVFTNQIFLIPLGAALMVIGSIIFLFVALKKESMRLQSLLNPTDSYDSDKGDE